MLIWMPLILKVRRILPPTPQPVLAPRLVRWEPNIIICFAASTCRRRSQRNRHRVIMRVAFLSEMIGVLACTLPSILAFWLTSWQPRFTPVGRTPGPTRISVVLIGIHSLIGIPGLIRICVARLMVSSRIISTYSRKVRNQCRLQLPQPLSHAPPAQNFTVNDKAIFTVLLQ